MKELTMRKLKALGDNEVFAGGIIDDDKLYDFPVRWIAVAGNGYFDWTIYCQVPQKSIAYIKMYGDKIHDREIIRRLVPCTDEAFDMYRH